MRKKLAFICIVCLIVIPLLSVNYAVAKPFFQGKHVRLVVAYSPGGGYDTYARLIARHLSKHIPGNPNIIVQNMPGGGGIVCANWLYNLAPKNGTVIAHLPWRIWGFQLAKDPKVKFDFKNMNAVGVAAMDNAILFFRKDRFKTFDEIKKSPKPVTVGAGGRVGTAFVLGNVVEKVVGQKLFNYVTAYPGSREYSLAVRQGELDGAGNTKDSFMDLLGDYWKEGQLMVAVQTGTAEEGKRDPDFPDAPVVSELATTEKGKMIAESTALLATLGRPFWLPPGVPKKRVKMLRDAFWNCMKDPKLLKEAQRLNRPIRAQRGEALQKSWEKAIAAPPEAVEIVKDIFRR
jgi:tripartite-type tricarboxylate transporter receptor subunit TctC